MNEKEISELRRRLRSGKNNISAVCGCYVNERREILSRFREGLGLLSEEETDRILALLKKSLSGTLGRNLVDLSFPTRAVLAGSEHQLLCALRDSELKDEATLEAFYQKIIGSLQLEGSYAILLACDSYDIPYRGRDGERFLEGSSEVYRHIICSVCPIRETRSSLSISVQEKRLCSVGAERVLAQPELGFLFPAFDDRSTNLYGALYYTRNAADNHPELVEALFRTPLPLPAALQRESFQELVAETVGEDCSLTVVQAIQDQLTGLIEEHKEQHIPEPLRISHSTLEGVLESCEIEEEKRLAFARGYQEVFGEDTTLPPRNLVDPKRMELSTPEVSIRVSPEHSALVQTRVIDGVKYILVRAEEGVSVNGIPICIRER